MGRLVPVRILVVKADYGYDPYDAKERSPLPNAAILAGGGAAAYGGSGLYNARKLPKRSKNAAKFYRDRFNETRPGAVEASRKAKKYRASLGPTPTGRLARVDPVRSMQDRKASQLEADAKAKRATSTAFARKARQSRDLVANVGTRQRSMYRSGAAFAAGGVGLAALGVRARMKENQ